MSMKSNHAVLHHARMLADTTRLDAYARALASVIRDGDTVVDIGAGTGVLSAIALNSGASHVNAIEYFDWAHNISKSALAKFPSSITSVKGSSFEITLDMSPQVLVTETIGQIGPEENMVELIADFCDRHPSVERIVPSVLRVFAQPILAAQASGILSETAQSYLQASRYKLDFTDSMDEILDALGACYQYADLQHSTRCGPPKMLVEYMLGRTRDSSFRGAVDLRDDGVSACNAVHLYFEADLAPGVTLSSGSTNRTHWQHAFLVRPPKRDLLSFEYTAGSGEIEAQWTTSKS